MIEFALVKEQLDRLIFENLVKYHGMKQGLVDGKTKHLVVIEEDLLHLSNKIRKVILEYKSPPKIVKIEWLIETLEKGEIVDAERFLVDTSKLTKEFYTSQ